MNVKIKEVQFQRNGISGEPFHAVWFTLREEGKTHNLIAVLSDNKGGCFVIDPLAPESHWRGDNFEPDMRYAIVSWYGKKYSLVYTEAKKQLNDGLRVAVY